MEKKYTGKTPRHREIFRLLASFAATTDPDGYSIYEAVESFIGEQIKLCDTYLSEIEIELSFERQRIADAKLQLEADLNFVQELKQWKT